MYINLGIGIPTLATNYFDPKIHVTFHSENGILGMGPYPLASEVDPVLINASKEVVTVLPGASFFSSSDSFGMARGRFIDLTMLGGFQVDQHANVANWIVPGVKVKGMGGAMDLVNGCEKLCITMEHTSKGKSKVLKSCTLPLTGKGVVDCLVTEFAFFTFKEGKMILEEIAEETTLEYVRANTEAEFVVRDKLGRF